jgi:hypothetical protein
MLAKDYDKGQDIAATDAGYLRIVTNGGLVNLETGTFVGKEVLSGIASPFYYRKLRPEVTVILSNE